VVQDLGADLVLTGAQSSDRGWGQVGVALAELLGLPHASLALRIEITGTQAVVLRELESNSQEQVELELPALVTVQTGINEPRYVSVTGIRRVRALQIQHRTAEELGLSEDQIGRAGSSIAREELAHPAREGRAELLEGSLETICDRVAQIIREKGGVA